MDLSETAPSVTDMRWNVDVNVMGTLANVGARLLESTAQKMMAQFFTCVRQKLESPTAAPAASP